MDTCGADPELIRMHIAEYDSCIYLGLPVHVGFDELKLSQVGMDH